MSVFGVWMWPQSVRLQGAQTVVSRCARIGVTDIVFLTKGLAGTTSCLSEIAPPCCERDLLGELLDAAHARGIRVHAWLTSASDEHYKQLYPQSGRFHYVRGADREHISLADGGYLAYMQKFVSELCSKYDIDGLHLDYIRYNHLLYGWSEADCARYAAAGADVKHLRALMERTFLKGDQGDPECIFNAYRSGDPSVYALANSRRRDVVHFAKTLADTARAQSSRLILSAALMPEGAYDDIAFSDLHYGQNYADAAKIYDYALPMAYSKAYEKDSGWVRAVALGTLKRGLKTVMGLHAYEGGTGESLTADAAALKNTPIDGICLFREGAFVMGITDGSTFHLINPLDHAITAVHTDEGTPLLARGQTIEPGKEAQLSLPASFNALRVFCGDTQVSVYVTEEKSKS